MNDLLTKQEVADRFRISIRTLEKWMESGSISYVKLRGFVRFREEEVERDLQRFKHRAITGRSA